MAIANLIGENGALFRVSTASVPQELIDQRVASGRWTYANGSPPEAPPEEPPTDPSTPPEAPPEKRGPGRPPKDKG
jgi:hypothetical protein